MKQVDHIEYKPDLNFRRVKPNTDLQVMRPPSVPFLASAFLVVYGAIKFIDGMEHLEYQQEHNESLRQIFKEHGVPHDKVEEVVKAHNDKKCAELPDANLREKCASVITFEPINMW